MKHISIGEHIELERQIWVKRLSSLTGASVSLEAMFTREFEVFVHGPNPPGANGRIRVPPLGAGSAKALLPLVFVKLAFGSERPEWFARKKLTKLPSGSQVTSVPGVVELSRSSVSGERSLNSNKFCHVVPQGQNLTS